MLPREQLTRFVLIEGPALRGQEHRMHPFPGAKRLMAQVKRLGQHDLPAPAAIGRVVRLMVLVGRIIAYIDRAYLHEALFLRAADHALPHDRIDHFRKQRHNIDLHSSRPSMLSM